MELILSKDELEKGFESLIESGELQGTEHDDLKKIYLACGDQYADHIEKNKDSFSDDRYKRLYAEFDNYKKRTNNEAIRLRKTASKDVIISMLGIVDDFERIEVMSDGVSLIYNKLINELKKLGAVKIEVLGEKYDCDTMEAITTTPHENVDCVVDVVSNGYTLNGEVIRFPKVIVGK